MTSLAGSFLVASPMLEDPNFARAVVLLLQHGPDGAFGLVVNRPAHIEGVPLPLFAGGPCPVEGVLMVHGHAEWAQPAPDQPKAQIAPGIFVGDASCLSRISDAQPGQPLRFRIFRGYAGWGPEQLEGELEAGAWRVVPASGQLLFGTPPEELWGRLMPPRIPESSLN